MPRLRTFGGLWIEDAAQSTRPRPLALLALVAGEGAKGLSRDRALAILWPESDAPRARHALSQTLYSLRRDLGDHAIVTTPDLRLRAALPSDVAEFRDAIAARRWSDAAGLYEGPFLDGVYLGDAPEFERWVEEQRATLAADGLRAIDRAARECAERGDHDGARLLLGRLARLDPFDARAAVAYMESLAAAGDRAGALAHGLAYGERVRRELEAEPDGRVTALVERLREAVSEAGSVSKTDPSELHRTTTPTLAPTIPPPAPTPARRAWPAIVAIAVTFVLFVLLERRSANASRADLLAGRRFYEEGLRAFFQYEAPTADRLFRAAVREGPPSAMMAYYAWRAAVVVGDSDQNTLADRALALAASATPRDSLLIATTIIHLRGDPRALADARLLAARYPDDPEALIRAAEVVREDSLALTWLERAAMLDSAAGASPCRACEALERIATRNWARDSIDAADRALRRWIALRPRDAAPWRALAEQRVSRGDRAQADEALRRFEAMGGQRTDEALRSLVWNLRSDDVDAVATQCDGALATRDSTMFDTYRWYCAIGLRQQGRRREALALAQSRRTDVLLTALLELETGQPRRAESTWRRIAAERGAPSVPAGVRAREVPWFLTLAATAAEQAGDTVAALALADSIQRLGAASLFWRDPLLHHAVRGLVHARAGRLERAADELRASIWSPTFGYTRANYELGRVLLALGRSAEGIPVVRAALHGGIEGANLYVTRTELHALLADLFAAAGQTDSAAAHRAVVARAWRHADPGVR